MPGLGDDDIELQVNKKHLIIRIVAFIIALAIAIGGIGYGIYAWISSQRTQPGIYTITFNKDTSVGAYTPSIGLVYNVQNTSEQDAGSLMSSLKTFGSEKAASVYKLINSENAYKVNDIYSINNIYAINDQVGQILEIDVRLYNVLLDALYKTNNTQEYNLFSGILNTFWKMQLAREINPKTNDFLKKQLNICLEVSKKEYYSLNLETKIVDGFSKYYATLNVDSKVNEILDASEEMAEIKEKFGVYQYIDLNVLFDSYYAELVAEDFTNSGYKEGMIVMYNGSYVSLGSTTLQIEYPVYGMNGKNVTTLGYINKIGKSRCSSIRSFPVYDYEYDFSFTYYYEDGNLVSYNSYYDYRTGFSTQNSIMNSMMISDDEKLYDLTLLNLKSVINNDGTLSSYQNIDEGVCVLFKDQTTLNINQTVKNDFINKSSYTLNYFN